MAAVFTISPPLLRMNEKHIGTRVTVYNDAERTQKIAEKTDYDNLLNITMYNEFVDGEEYFAEARYILEPGGLQGAGKMTSFIASNTNEVDIRVNVPTVVGLPILTANFKLNEFPHTNFNVYLDVPLVDNTYIVSTTWVIEDIMGKVVFISPDDSSNLTSIHIPIFLDMSEQYIVKAAVTLNNDIVSDFGSMLLVTSGDVNDEFMILRDTIEYAGLDIEKFKTSIPADYDHTEVYIYDEVNNDVIYTKEVNGETIDLSDFHYDGTYTIGVKAYFTDETFTEMKYLYVTKNRDDVLPGLLPYELRG